MRPGRHAGGRGAASRRPGEDLDRQRCEVRDVDIEPILDGPVLRPLREPDAFAKVFVDPETRTIAWPNGADLDPDMLYDPSLEPASGRGPKVTVLRPAA